MANEVAKNGAQTGQVTTPKALQRFMDKLKIEASFNETDPQAIMGEVVGKVLEAENMDDVFAAQDKVGLNGKDMADIEIDVLSFDVTDSTLDENDGKTKGLGYYMWVTAVNLATGEEVRFGTGAPNIVSVLWRARELEKLPMQCVIRAKDQGGGKTLLSIRPLPKRAITSAKVS